jgi:lipoprotein signal peptidase
MRLVRIALLVAAGDYITKAVAASWLAASGDTASVIGFDLVHNDQGAFGLSAGVYTWQINLALTLSAIVLIAAVSRQLTRLDPAAPEALGLIVGGAIGNFVSLVGSPAGVLDFIAVRPLSDSAIVLNFADIAAYGGLALLLRTGVLIARAMRRGETPGLPAFALAAGARMEEVEIPRVVFVEPPAPRRRDNAPTPDRSEDSPTATPSHRKSKRNRPSAPPPQSGSDQGHGSEARRAEL